MQHPGHIQSLSASIQPAVSDTVDVSEDEPIQTKSPVKAGVERNSENAGGVFQGLNRVLTLRPVLSDLFPPSQLTWFLVKFPGFDFLDDTFAFYFPLELFEDFLKLHIPGQINSPPLRGLLTAFFRFLTESSR